MAPTDNSECGRVDDTCNIEPPIKGPDERSSIGLYPLAQREHSVAVYSSDKPMGRPADIPQRPNSDPYTPTRHHDRPPK